MMSESGNSTAGQATRDKERPDWLEVAATALLGIAAVLIAWTTYQSQLWGGVQDTRNTQSALEIVDAADDLGRADAERSLDQLLFGDYILRPDLDEAELLLSQMSDEGRIASERWWVTEEARPFDGDAYVFGVYGEGLAKRQAAFSLFDSATEANQNGDDYVLAATIIALVLFLAGVSLVLKGRLTRTVLVAGSGVILAVVAVYVAGLPRASGAASEEGIKTAATEEANAEFAAIVAEAELADAELLSDAEAEELDAVEPSPDDQPVGEEPGVDAEAAPEQDPVPDASFLTQGGTAFAVYLDVIEASESSGELDDDFGEAIADLDETGVAWAVGPLDCDDGSVEGLGLDAGDYIAAAAYFESMEDAESFAAAYGISADAIVEVRTICLD